MLTIDPFKPAPRHATPRAPRHATGTLEALGAVFIGAVLFWILTAASGAAPDPFAHLVTRDATRAVQRFTPSPAPLTHGVVSRGVTGHYRAR